MGNPAPILLRIRTAETTARARALLRQLDKETTARRRFKHFAAKGFLAVSEMRSALGELGKGDRGRWEADIKLIEAVLLKISRGSR